MLLRHALHAEIFVPDFHAVWIRRSYLRVHLVTLSEIVFGPCSVCANFGTGYFHGRYGAGRRTLQSLCRALARLAVTLCASGSADRCVSAFFSPTFRRQYQFRLSKRSTATQSSLRQCVQMELFGATNPATVDIARYDLSVDERGHHARISRSSW